VTPAAYRTREGVTTLRGPRKKDPPVVVRTVFAWSSANAPAARAARAPSRPRPRRRPAPPLPRRDPGEGQAGVPRNEVPRVPLPPGRHQRRHSTGKSALSWQFDQAALDAEAATDGWYALLTNLDGPVGPADVLTRYKGQEVSERRYGAFKDPLAEDKARRG
jgi:hypothetical protein